MNSRTPKIAGTVIAARRRMVIGRRIACLFSVPTFLSFCRGLDVSGVALDSIAGARLAPELVLVGNNVARTFREIGLHEEIARALRRWDKIDYAVPLTSADQVFVVSRSRWMRFSGWAHDLPSARWQQFCRATNLLGLQRSAEVMAALFREGVAAGPRHANAARRAGYPPAQLSRILGPSHRQAKNAA
jgi:hypothetical protein